MIPPIIHQTWKSENIPERFQPYCLTWRDLNPGWDYRLWTDRELLEFVATEYPDFLDLFCGYREGVQRADAGRYLLLHHFGGVYADIDAECLQSFKPLEGEERVVLCHEPEVHWKPNATPRGHPFLLFNGVMASPAGHPFWVHLLSRMKDVKDASDVLDSTGPCLLTGSVLSFPDSGAIRIEGAVFFNPVDYRGESVFPGNSAECYAIHHWAGTWWRSRERWACLKRQWRSVLKRYYRLKSIQSSGTILEVEKARERVTEGMRGAPLPSGANIAILVPFGDGRQHLAGFLTAIDSLDYPRDCLKLVFCESEGNDRDFDLLISMTEALKRSYRDIAILRMEGASAPGESDRLAPQDLRYRLSRLAGVRNYMIERGLNDSDDWALWIDLAVWKFPPDIISRLIAAGGRIAVPNCVRVPGGKSVDKGSFSTKEIRRDYRYYRGVKRGLFHSPEDSSARLHLSDLRHSDLVPLDGVGGSVLLVDAALHRSGLTFPEAPYDHLIDTEGFGRLARDCGIIPVGLPRTEVLRVPW